MKFNWDSGAATTALPTSLFEGRMLKEVGNFTVASGASIPNYGEARLSGKDEEGDRRKITGSVTEVHKPLGSASEFSKSHDTMLWEEGGSMMPKNGPVARGMRQEYRRLVALHGEGDHLWLHREGALYNFYLKIDQEPDQLNPVEKTNQIREAPIFRRQATWP